MGRPHPRPRNHHSSRNRAGGVSVLVHHHVAGRVGVGTMVCMSVSRGGVVRSVRLAGSLQVRTVAPSSGGHSHGDLSHLL